ncbi:HAMP domain-containing sensor histidine kinase [Shouchella clausii]
MQKGQPRRKRFMFTLFQSHSLYAGFIFGVFSIILAYSLDPVGGIIDIQLWQMLVLLGMVLSGSLLCSWWIAGRVTRPLERMTAIIERMATGDYSERLPLGGSHELFVIQQKFNAMADALERATAENERLQMSKQRMLADLSHDLKTPITTIQGYAKALEVGIADNKEAEAKYLKLILQTSTYAADLIHQIAVLTSLDRPDYPLAKEKVDVAELLRVIVADHYEWLERKQFKLEMDVKDDEVQTWCDPQLIRRAVSNLLSNAIKHNPAGTSVAVRLLTSDEWLQLVVADRGIGIPEKWSETVFEPFVRADQARQKEGAGLGLAIARQIAERHGGRLLLHCRPGETTFVLEIPLASAWQEQ